MFHCQTHAFLAMSQGVFIATSLVLHLLSAFYWRIQTFKCSLSICHKATCKKQHLMLPHFSQHCSTEHRTCRINGICSQSDAQCLVMLLTVMPVRLMDQYNVSSHYRKEDIPPSIISSINRTTASMQQAQLSHIHMHSYLRRDPYPKIDSTKMFLGK